MAPWLCCQWVGCVERGDICGLTLVRPKEIISLILNTRLMWKTRRTRTTRCVKSGVLFIWPHLGVTVLREEGFSGRLGLASQCRGTLSLWYENCSPVQHQYAGSVISLNWCYLSYQHGSSCLVVGASHHLDLLADYLRVALGSKILLSTATVP